MVCAMPLIPMSAEGSAPGAPEVLRLAGVAVSFATPGGVVCATQDVNLSVTRGECLGVVGESGAGKSVSFLALLGLLPPNARVSGSAQFCGTELLGSDPRALDRLRARDFDGLVRQFVHDVLDGPRQPAPAVTPDFWRQFTLQEELEEIRQYRPSAFEALPVESDAIRLTADLGHRA